MSKPEEDFDPIDRILAGKLNHVSPPKDLRTRVLASTKKIPSPRRTQSPWGMLALVSVLVVMATIAFLQSGSPPTQLQQAEAIPPTPQPLQDAQADIARFLETDFQFDLKTNSQEALQAWFLKNKNAQRFEVPPKLAGLDPYGCVTFNWRGHPVTVVCLNLDGKVVHVAVFPKATFSPAVTDPLVDQTPDWAIAAWTTGPFTYLLFAPGDQSLAQDLISG
jgi:hypothetical protein